MATDQQMQPSLPVMSAGGIGIELSSVPQTQNITVNKDNVLQAAKIIQETGDADSYSVRVEQYLQSLQTLVDNLVTSARQYGYSDQQIADSFS